MSLFLSRLNKTITVTGVTQTGEDGGGQPIFNEASKGTVRGRIQPKVRPDELDGPDLNPVISQYLAITALPSFTITTDDKLVDGSDTYDIVGVATVDGRTGPHHMEIDLRRIT
ncbi:MAG TPA: hypothetical protein VF377_12265 [Acidimicrobiia bacterium]